MFEILYNLFMACGMFTIAFSCLIYSMSMFRKSNTICDKCKKEMKK